MFSGDYMSIQEIMGAESESDYSEDSGPEDAHGDDDDYSAALRDPLGSEGFGRFERTNADMRRYLSGLRDDLPPATPSVMPLSPADLIGFSPGAASPIRPPPTAGAAAAPPPTAGATATGGASPPPPAPAVPPPDDDPFYDPDADADDEKWVQQHSAGMQAAQAAAGGMDGPIPNMPSDAVLSCPFCFAVLSYHSQQHVKFRHQYRAVFVQNVVTVPTERMVFESAGKGKQRPTRVTGPVAAPGDEVFHPVNCATCATEVGVVDSDDVFVFFDVAPSGLAM